MCSMSVLHSLCMVHSFYTQENKESSLVMYYITLVVHLVHIMQMLLHLPEKHCGSPSVKYIVQQYNKDKVHDP